MKFSAFPAALLAASVILGAAFAPVAEASSHKAKPAVGAGKHHAAGSKQGSHAKNAAHGKKATHGKKGHLGKTKGRHGKKSRAPHAWLVSDTQTTAPQPAAVSEVLAQEERIYDGPLPGDGYSVAMDAMPDANGRTECVQLLKTLLDAPRTTLWKEGRRLKQYFSAVKPGTAIATFVHGRYPQGGGHGKHAAIFVRATQAGIYVLDQFAGRVEVVERFIPWHHPNDRRASNNAISYSTVRW